MALVEEAPVLGAEGFDDEHHDVGSRQRGLEDGLVDGVVEGGELLGGEVGGVGEGGLAAGADEGEGGVEDDGGLLGLGHILVGVADGYGAHGAGEASTDAGNGEQERQEEGEGGGGVVPPGGRRAVAEGGVEEEEGGDEGQAEEDEVPVAEGFGEEDGAEVGLVAEFGEEGPGGAAAGVARIDGVGEVDGEHEGVDGHEVGLCHKPVGTAVFGPGRKGQQEEEGVEGVGVADGGGVEAEGAGEERRPGELGEAGAVDIPEFGYVGHTGYHVEDVDECDVAQEGGDGAAGWHGTRIGSR